MRRSAVFAIALLVVSPALAQQPIRDLPTLSSEPQLQLGPSNFALPVIDYQAPGGTWKRGSGIIIGHQLAPNASVGIGVFKMKPKYEDPTEPKLPTSGKSRKVSLGLSLRF